MEGLRGAGGEGALLQQKDGGTTTADIGEREAETLMECAHWEQAINE